MAEVASSGGRRRCRARRVDHSTPTRTSEVHQTFRRRVLVHFSKRRLPKMERLVTRLDHGVHLGTGEHVRQIPAVELVLAEPGQLEIVAQTVVLALEVWKHLVKEDVDHYVRALLPEGLESIRVGAAYPASALVRLKVAQWNILIIVVVLHPRG